MKLATHWLNNYFTEPQSTKVLADALEQAGIEVEQIMYSRKLDDNIVVGHVVGVHPHPDADKLRVAAVEVGASEPLQIVCGAPNLALGQYVAVAQVGTVLPDGSEISAAKLRGVTSRGMLCSERELGWSDAHEGIVVIEQQQVGTKLCDLDKSSDIVDVKSSANRSDLQSYIGIAREVAAQLSINLRQPQTTEQSAADDPSLADRVDALALGYSLSKLRLEGELRNVPLVQTMLSAAGIRTVSPIVDITNFVMLETGQPLHAFDADKVTLPVGVRQAKSGEKLTTLDGKERSLTPQDLVIADADGPIALAGVMGGAATEISADTKTILLETAVFDAATVRKMAKRHGLRSDASARFERQLPAGIMAPGRNRAVELLAEAGLKVQGSTEVMHVDEKPRTLVVSAAKVSRLLGLEVRSEQVVELLNRLEIEAEVQDAMVRVEVPWWRPDMAEMPDVAEEVIKLLGYDALPATIPPLRDVTIEAGNNRSIIQRLRYGLLALGLFEVATYSFVSPRDIEEFSLRTSDHLALQNPMSEDQAFMRRNLMASLRNVMVRNQHYAKSFGVYELSKVFISGEEPLMLGVSVMGGYSYAKQAADLLSRELRVALEFVPSNLPNFTPGRQAEIMLGGARIGSIGELHPKLTRDIKSRRIVSILELELQPILEASQAHAYTPVSRFPSISRDIAIVVGDKTLWSQIEAVVSKHVDGSAVTYLNTYQGAGIEAGYKSVAFRVTFSSLERTLTDAEADTQTTALVAALESELNAKLRS